MSIISTLPNVMVVRPAPTGSLYVTSPETQNGYLYPGESSVTSPSVKIVVETANSNSRYIHLRFSHNNRYWERDPITSFLKATSNQSVDDTSNPSCTLFEAIFTPGTENISFIHVQSGGRVQSNSPNERLTVVTTGGPNNTNALFAIIDWGTLVILPKFIAFKGDNGNYLRGAHLNFPSGRAPVMQFLGIDPNHENAGYEVFPFHDGNIRIKSELFNRFWRSNHITIVADIPATDNDTLIANRFTLFWPVRVNNTTIALQALTTNNVFCMRYNYDGSQAQWADILEARSNNIIDEARFELEELVLDREIYDVRYRMEDSRIYDETPFLAGTGSATNNTNTESTLAIRISYTDTTSRSFTHSLSVELGVTTSFQTRIPFITEAGIEVSTTINNTSEWGSTTETSRTAEATYTVTVPPMSEVIVNYVGIEGKCNVPFSYVQRDRRSSNGTIITSQHIDGIFEGVNSYNFNFEQLPIRPL